MTPITLPAKRLDVRRAAGDVSNTPPLHSVHTVVMRFKQDSLVLLLVASLIAVSYGAYRTGKRDSSLPTRTARRAPADRSIVVDQSSLMTAEALVRLPTTQDERRFAEDALRSADQEMDLAFAQAVRHRPASRGHFPGGQRDRRAAPTGTSSTRDRDQPQVRDLTAAVARANATAAQSLNDRLNLAKAQAALDQDEVDDAHQDLRRAGGDPQGRMQAMIDEHDAASRSSDSVHITVTPAVNTHGLVRRIQALQALYAKQAPVEQAKSAADSLATLSSSGTIAWKREPPRPRLHRPRASATTPRRRCSRLRSVSALAEKARATLDQRVDNQHRLSDVYTGWIAVVRPRSERSINRALHRHRGRSSSSCSSDFFSRVGSNMPSALATMDRRRTQTLYMVTRVSLQVIAVLLILLVVFGRPTTSAPSSDSPARDSPWRLKDFIVGFIGWFVLMGKNGIRIGDLVEINGVTGEVVELGMFYTVLLETGVGAIRAIRPDVG